MFDADEFKEKVQATNIFQVYPTTIRTLGIGTASSWARVGAMITPFLAQVLNNFVYQEYCL